MGARTCGPSVSTGCYSEPIVCGTNHYKGHHSISTSGYETMNREVFLNPIKIEPAKDFRRTKDKYTVKPGFWYLVAAVGFLLALLTLI